MTAVAQWLADVDDLPRIECELLLGEALNLSRAQVIAYPEHPIPRPTLAELYANAARLRDGEPLAYVIGYREFWGLTFKVTRKVLIPRPETELLVEWCCELAPAGGRILDLGTGSGAVAVAVARERPDLVVTAIDRSPGALGIARENAIRHQVDIEFVQSDWFEACEGTWDVIVSNPPYIAPEDPHLDALWAEPRGALVSRSGGLHDLYQIVDASPNHLRPGGFLIVEHGYDQAAAVTRAMDLREFRAVQSIRDLAGIERATLGCASSKSI